MENVGPIREAASRMERIFGERVREFRRARGLTQEAVAEWMSAAGFPMHQTTVAKLESGGRPTPVGEVVALATLLVVPVGDLLETSDEIRADMERAALLNLVAAQARELAELEERRNRLRQEQAAARAELDKRGSGK